MADQQGVGGLRAASLASDQVRHCLRLIRDAVSRAYDQSGPDEDARYCAEQLRKAKVYVEQAQEAAQDLCLEQLDKWANGVKKEPPRGSLWAEAQGEPPY